MIKITVAIASLILGSSTVAWSQGNRPRQAAAPAALKAHLYMVSFARLSNSERIEFTDISDFKDMAACQSAANGAKVIKAQEDGNNGALNVAFVCVEVPPE
jgi:hypothetical protein